MIHLKNISKIYEKKRNHAVNNVSLRVFKGETLVLLGSSGSGKTTLLKMINRLIEPSNGQIFINDKNIKEYKITELRHMIGYVFQGIGLFPHMTIERNICIVLRLKGLQKSRCLQRAHDLLEMMQLEPQLYAKRYPDQLSGGQQQRIGVARALAANPDFLLMDEPFGAVDAITRDSLQNEMLQLKQKLKKTIIFVTHDIHEALRLADRIAVMHQGQLEQIGTGEDLLHNPASEFVVQLFQNIRASN